MTKIRLLYLGTSMVLILLKCSTSHAQQFNSDSYLTMPHGTGTMIFTTGHRNSTLYMAMAVLPRFEVTVSANLYNPTDSLKSFRRFTSNVFVKYMFWVNAAKSGGGGAFLAGDSRRAILTVKMNIPRCTKITGLQYP